MSCVIVIREARADDETARAALIRGSYSGYHRDAFFLFFFQELTLQAGVLLGAVLFIFCGVSLGGLLLLLPVLAAVVEVSVRVTHTVMADKQVQEMRKETVGLVAEYRGPLVAGAPRAAVVHESGWRPSHQQPVHTRVVGTVSLSEFWGPESAGWMHGLAVHPEWQRLGAGSALEAGARAAARARWAALHAALSELQRAAARRLRAAGWAPRAAHRRRLLAEQLTLAISHWTCDTIS